MTNIVYMDANSLAYSAKAGGMALLDKIFAYYQSAGYELKITDVVEPVGRISEA